MTLPAPLVAALRKSEQGHKFTHGHLLVLAGGVGRGGAARLAARAGLRIGAGVVTLACPPAAVLENAARLDAIMLQPLRDAAGLVRVLDDSRFTALCLGPALGLGAREEDLVLCALGANRPAVLDADALTLLAGNAQLRAALHGSCVLTPHMGEFARLFPDLAATLPEAPEARLGCLGIAAARLGCVVVLKGPHTLIAAPDGKTAQAIATGVNAVPWLATAGAGDVLAGMIAGLLARGFCPTDAALVGSTLHQSAAREFGPGLIAEDLPDLIPSALRALGV
jgi:hydroxyethylthiazole kinase-like uncharacterized protein yjeF